MPLRPWWDSRSHEGDRAWAGEAKGGTTLTGLLALGRGALAALAALVGVVLFNSGCGITTGPRQWIRNGFKVGPELSPAAGARGRGVDPCR